MGSPNTLEEYKDVNGNVVELTNAWYQEGVKKGSVRNGASLSGFSIAGSVRDFHEFVPRFVEHGVPAW